ncbi:MAG: serine/threonine-protein phosphatase [Polyangiaceae bacterium]|nr:serine/threonine-protein phosphatase [Polyangiaceae bacterium]
MAVGSLIGAGSSSEPSPSRVLTMVNRILIEDIRRLGTDRHMTISLLRRLDDRRFAHAGLHLDLAIYRRDRQQVELVKTEGMWLGVTEAIENHLQDLVFEVYPGDVVLLYTDGLLEAERDDEPFGIGRPCDVFADAGRRGDADVVRTALIAALAPWQRADDVSFVVLERLGSDEGGRSAR